MSKGQDWVFITTARDLVKFIPQSVSATTEMKAEMRAIFQEAEQADREILHS